MQMLLTQSHSRRYGASTSDTGGRCMRNVMTVKAALMAGLAMGAMACAGEIDDGGDDLIQTDEGSPDSLFRRGCATEEPTEMEKLAIEAEMAEFGVLHSAPVGGV